MPSPSRAPLTEEQQMIGSEVRRFVEKEVMPVATELEHADEYPADLVEQLKGLGMFGATIPQEYGGLELPFPTFAGGDEPGWHPEHAHDGLRNEPDPGQSVLEPAAPPQYGDEGAALRAVHD